MLEEESRLERWNSKEGFPFIGQLKERTEYALKHFYKEYIKNPSSEKLKTDFSLFLSTSASIGRTKYEGREYFILRIKKPEDQEHRELTFLTELEIYMIDEKSFPHYATAVMYSAINQLGFRPGDFFAESIIPRATIFDCTTTRYYIISTPVIHLKSYTKSKNGIEFLTKKYLDHKKKSTHKSYTRRYSGILFVADTKSSLRKLLDQSHRKPAKSVVLGETQEYEFKLQPSVRTFFEKYYEENYEVDKKK
jgi:hypothetical protein